MVYRIGSGTLPEQDMELVRRLSLRWMRAVEPHNKWAKTAKVCIDFLEGRQYTDEERALLAQAKRTPLTLNKIAALYRLVVGYQSSNRLDVSFLPTSDNSSSEDLADVLNNIFLAEAGRMDLQWTDTEVFCDGIMAGRGFWDYRLCFEDNDFGEIKATAEDPFSIYIDPDADTYNLHESAAYIQKSVWTDIDSVNAQYGPEAAQSVEYLMNPTYTSHMLSFLGEADIAPARFFGGYADDKALGNWADVYYTDFIDRQAKRVRLLESQYKITGVQDCFVDLETGDKEAIPEEWLKPENHWMIEQSMSYAEQRGNPLRISRRPVTKIRWTVTCADVVLFDGWSPYRTYTKIGYFPYFRRGQTRGMLDDLIDPQRERNRKRSIMVDILNRNANSGWIWEEGVLDPEQEENLRNNGSAPGVNVKYKRVASGNSEAPKRIEPGGFPQGLDRLEEKAVDDMHQISGINESALGQLDRVQSGRAIEARQRQAVLSIQMYQDNFSRSKKLCGKKFLEIVQRHYTEPRIYRVMGEDSRLATIEINKKITTGQNSITRLNDITIGKYSVNIDETPISATFKQAQFEETMMLLEKLGPIGQALAQTAPDLIIDQTSLPRKNDWKQALMGATAMAPPPGAVPAQGGGMPVGPQAGTPEGMVS